MLRESHKVLKHLMRQEALLKDELTEARRSNERADSLNVDYLKNGKTRNSGGQGGARPAVTAITAMSPLPRLPRFRRRSPCVTPSRAHSGPRHP